MSRDPAPIRAVLDEFGTRAGISHASETGHIWAHWGELVGEQIATHAQPTSLRDGVLRVRADSSVWATEIGYLGDDIRGRINSALGRALVKEVKVWTGPGHEPMPRAPLAAGSMSAAPAPTEPSLEGPPEDPISAFERARNAWARRFRKGPFGASSPTSKIPKNSR